MEKAFNLPLSGNALVDAIKNAAKVPMKRIIAASALSDKLGGVLAEILALVRHREGLKAVDLATEVQLLVREYRAKVEADRQDLVRQIAEEDARISVEFVILFKTDTRSAELDGEYKHLSSRIPEAEATIARIEVELKSAQRTLAGYHDRQTEIKSILCGLKFARGAAADNLQPLFASREAHRAELSIPPLSKAELEAVAREEAQTRITAKIEEINL